MSHSNSKTLEKKVAHLEAEAGVPIRLLRAQQLANLRERLAGPLPLRIPTQELSFGNRILDDDLVERVAGAYHTEQKAHKAFVESMLAARGVISPIEEWATDSHGVENCEDAV